MKTLKLLTAFALATTLFTSCHTENIVTNVDDTISLNELLGSYELWYVDINQTTGFGNTPFLDIAFTLSFRNGVVYANNNLVGIGDQGNGFGISVGTYDAYDMILDVYHDIDGYQTFDIYQIDDDTIELYNPFDDTSYFLNGFQRSNFDYDFVFYDNIHYFLQEYEAWEKTYTSQVGILNEFDNENYLRFLSGENDTFESSQDINIANPANIIWDYIGIYSVNDVPDNMYLKTLTLDYDFFNNEFFELNVINDQVIELFHSTSGTYYEFTGNGYIQFLRSANGTETATKTNNSNKKRIQITPRKENPRTSNRS